MKVWIAQHLDMACEEYITLGVFSTEAKAKKALKKCGWMGARPYSMEIDKEYPEEE